MAAKMNGRTESGAIVKVDLGAFLKTVWIGLVSLGATGVVALFMMGRQQAVVVEQMGTLSTAIVELKLAVKGNTDAIAAGATKSMQDYIEAKSNVTAVEILMARFAENHDVFKQELRDLEEDLEQHETEGHRSP